MRLFADEDILTGAAAEQARQADPVDGYGHAGCQWHSTAQRAREQPNTSM